MPRFYKTGLDEHALTERAFQTKTSSRKYAWGGGWKTSSWTYSPCTGIRTKESNVWGATDRRRGKSKGGDNL